MKKGEMAKMQTKEEINKKLVLIKSLTQEKEKMMGKIKELTEIGEKLNSLKKENESMGKTIMSQKERSKKQSEQVTLLSKTNEEKDLRMKSMRVELERKDQIVSSLRADNEGLNQRAAALDKENEVLRGQLSIAQNQNITNTETIQQQKLELESKSTELSEVRSELEGAKQTLLSTGSEMEKVEGELKSTSEELERAKQGAESGLIEHNKQTGEIEGLRRQKEALLSQREDLHRENEAKESEMDRLKAEIEDLRATIASTEKSIESLAFKCNELTKQEKDNRKAKDENVRLRGQIEELLQGFNDQKIDVERMQSDNRALIAERKDFVMKGQANEETIKDLRKEVAMFKAKQVHWSEDEAKLQQGLSSIREEFEAAKRMQEKVESDRQSVLEGIGVIVAKRDSLTLQLSNLQSKQKHQTQCFEAKKQEMESRIAKLEALSDFLLRDRGAFLKVFAIPSKLSAIGLSGNLECLRALVTPSMVNQKIFMGMRIAHFVAASGSTAAMEELIRKGANVKAEDSQGTLPIDWAGSLAMLRLLEGFENGDKEGVDTLKCLRPGSSFVIAEALRKILPVALRDATAFTADVDGLRKELSWTKEMHAKSVAAARERTEALLLVIEGLRRG
jgi:chromosome segregation ATPase